MKLPHGEHAIIDDSKLLDYALNPDHPVGRHHAVLFDRLLGIGRTNFLTLKTALVAAAREVDAVEGKSTPHGTKYEQRLTMSGRDRTVTVLAIWLIESGSESPRLITVFVE